MIGATAVGTIGSTRLASAKEAEVPIETLSGKERRSVLNDYKNDSEVKKLRKFADSNGWVEQTESSPIRETQSGEQKYYSVVMRYSVPDSSTDSLYLTWTTANEFDTALYQYKQQSGDKQQSDEVVQTIYEVQEGAVTSDEKTVKNARTENDEVVVSAPEELQPSVSVQGVSTRGNGDCYKKCETYSCDEYNLSCVVDIIISAGIAVGSCITCGTIDLTKGSCLVCYFSSAAVIKTAGFDCNVGTGCSWEYKCVPSEEYQHSGSYMTCKDP